MAPEVVLDEEVYAHLKEQAEPFVDTPNTVLRRLLGLDPSVGANVAVGQVSDRGNLRGGDTPSGSGPNGSEPSVEPVRAPKGSLLPQTEYWRPILEALVEAGGTTAATEIIATVGRRLDDRLTELDRQSLRSGGIRWRNRAQFARLRMVERGLMVRGSPSGFWAITEEGRRFLTKQSA